MATKRIYYVTGNEAKFKSAQAFLDTVDLELVQVVLDIPEPQHDSIEEIANVKAEKAFEILQEPLFVNDSGWFISALNGFPGPYMKYVNHWFSPEDFLNLMKPYENREVILKQVVIYKDKITTKTFTSEIKGVILNRIGGTIAVHSDRVISLSADRLSLSEKKEQGIFKIDDEDKLWTEFSHWLKTKL